MSERQKRWLKFVVALGVSVVFSALFLGSIDLDQVWESLGHANYLYVVPALGLFALSVAVRAARWGVLFPGERRFTWPELIPSLLVGYAGNNLLPLRAGELLRAQHLADRTGVPRMRSFGTFMMERLFDSAVLSIFVLWGLLLVDAGAEYVGIGLLLFAAALSGFVACTVLAVKPGVVSWLAGLPVPFVSDRIRKIAVSLGESFLGGFDVLRHPARIATAAALSVAAWLLELSMYWLISVAFRLDVSFISVAFAGSAANVALSLPSAQGGVGPFHLTATEALVKFGVFKEAAAAYAIALHIFLIVPVSIVGLVVFWRSTLPGRRRERIVASQLEETAP